VLGILCGPRNGTDWKWNGPEHLTI